MLPTIALSFMRAMWSAVMMSKLPVVVTKMSAVSTTSSRRVDLVALHRGLQRADRIDLGDDHAAALAASDSAEPLPTSPKPQTTATLPPSITSVARMMTVGQRVAAAVDVVELGLGDRVVDVDRREEQRAVLLHLVQAVHTPVVVSSDTPRSGLGGALPAGLVRRV